jgi:hypothetical protein
MTRVRLVEVDPPDRFVGNNSVWNFYKGYEKLVIQRPAEGGWPLSYGNLGGVLIKFVSLVNLIFICLVALKK